MKAADEWLHGITMSCIQGSAILCNCKQQKGCHSPELMDPRHFFCLFRQVANLADDNMH